MFGHIGCQDQANHSFSEQLEFLSNECLHKVTVAFLKNLKVLSCMVELLDALIIRVDCAVCVSIDVVGIVKSIMSDIMTNTRSYKCN
jgi:hypothetical protein